MIRESVVHDAARRLASGSTAAGPLVKPSIRVQRDHEAEFGRNPEAFLKGNVLSLDIKNGLEKRSPKLGAKLGAFLKAMDALPMHWFVLLPDAARATAQLPAYVLTPAIEKYVERFGDNPALADLVGDTDLPKVQPRDNYIEAAWVPYLRGRTQDAEKDIGHTDVRRDEGGEGFNPNFVFTATMNGCAFTVTGSAKKDSFTAWHYQSPDSDTPGNPARFRAERTPMDWFGAEEYGAGEHSKFYEAQNLLWRNEGTWNIVSQVTEQVIGVVGAEEGMAAKTEEVSIRQATSRPLMLERGSEFAYFAKLFAGRAEAHLNLISSRTKKLPMGSSDAVDRALLSSLLAAAMLPLHEDATALLNVKSMEGLYEALLGIGKRKKVAIGEVGGLATALEQLETERLAKAQKAWFPDKDLQNRLRSFATNARNLAQEYADASWVDQSIDECGKVLAASGSAPELSEAGGSEKGESTSSAEPSGKEGAGGREEEASGGSGPALVDDDGGILPEARERFRDAYFQDLVDTPAYLTEGEGQVVANELGIAVQVFRGPTPSGYRRFENAGDGNCLIHALWQASAASRHESITDAPPSAIGPLRRRVAEVLRPSQQDYVLSLCAAAVMGVIIRDEEVGLGPTMRELLRHPSIAATRRRWDTAATSSSPQLATAEKGSKAPTGSSGPVEMPEMGDGTRLADIAVLHTGGLHWVMVQRIPVSGAGIETSGKLG